MTSLNPLTQALLGRLRELRERAGISPSELDNRLILGPGWTERFEKGAAIPSLDTLLAMVAAVGGTFSDLVKGLDIHPLANSVDRQIHFLADGPDLLLQFPYGAFDAVYRLPKATIGELEEVLETLRNGLARLHRIEAASPEEDETERDKAIKRDAVATAFLKATSLWPHANPSDLWWFLVSRAFCDRFNHPAAYARLDMGQSWKRTGGWALEEVFVRHYGPTLANKGVGIILASGTRKDELVAQLQVKERIEADKIDVFLTKSGKAETCFGVVHVKASFAERRTDDVPLSQALIAAGYTSILCTLDAKSSPAEKPVNKGELGQLYRKGKDERSAKRKDIEDDGYFTACFSYNGNTLPTPETQGAKARIYVCNFSNPDDAFAKFVAEEALKKPHH